MGRRQQTSSEDKIDKAPRERWQHGTQGIEIEIGKPGDAVLARRVQRIDTPVLSLHRSRKIGDAEVVAAARWLADYESGRRSRYVHPATAGIGGGSAAGADGVLLWGLDASTKLRAANQAIGRDGEALLIQAVHLGMSIDSIRKDWQCRWGDVCHALKTTLLALSTHYQNVDRFSFDGRIRREFELESST
ncbi:hypothetical protein ACELLULO517_15615 [Acidisoma cellulosilytica]|uniref:Uncharacterized protein n=1 Tax=Acidisoma cellulosilyticum TaxID=2802395 RepID=A0A963Z440_9PROT|nr:hypothetical protein [Acidisoma cellulosilyticum]MCB8881675.1 hypothetical protein [Acidisoma cellulosilyticum]